MNRTEIKTNHIDNSLWQINEHTKLVLSKKGFGTFASIHEILGIMVEEHEELKQAIHDNNYKNIKAELLDIATTCQFAIACIDQKEIDW